MDLNQTKPKPRPDIVDLTPPEKADQDLIKKDDSFPDVKPKKRPESDKYKGRTYDIYSVEIDGKETNVIEFKDGKRISSPQILQMFEEHKSASESIPGKQTSQEISNFLEKNNPTYDEFVRHFTAKRLNKGGVAEQMEMFGYTDEGVQQEAEKFVDKDAAPAKDITFMDAAKFVAELTPVIGDAMAAKEVYDELQKDDPNYFLAGALGGAAIIGLIPGIGDAAASAIRAGARKSLDVAKRIEVDPDAVGAMGGNIRLKPKKTLDDFGYKEDNPVTKGFGGSEDWLSGKIEQANKSKNLLDGATTAFLGTSKDKPLFLDTDFISSLKGARDEVRKKGEPQYDRLKKTVDKEGFDPNKTILIEVNHKGEAYIVEGNTRAALAKELGVPNIKAEIRYKNGAELVDSPFSPQNILEKSSTGSYQDALAISKKFDRTEDLAQAEKLIDSDELLEQWRKENGGKDQRLKNPAEKDAEAFYQGDITRKELQTLINSKLGDPRLFTLEDFPDMPTITDTVGSMGTKARRYGILGVKGKDGKRFDLEEGQRVGSRLDIPAYNKYDKWIVSIHDGNIDAGSVLGYGQAIRLKNIEFKSDPKMALDIARKKELKAADPETGKGAKYQTKATIARIHGDYVKEDPYELYEQAKLLLDDPEWTQVGMNPYRGSFFYDKKTGMPVLNAEEVIQVGPLVLAKKVKTPKLSELKKYFGGEFKDGKYQSAVRTKDGKVKVFNEGGITMDEQMELALGDVPDNTVGIDPVSGNEIPLGSSAEEVRDDIPAMLSPGEIVIPADVVKFHGVKLFEDLRKEAKLGYAKMEADGRIGGEPIDEPGPEDSLPPDEEELLNEILAMEENTGVVEAAAGVYTPPNTSVPTAPTASQVPSTGTPPASTQQVAPSSTTQQPNSVYGITTASGTPVTANTALVNKQPVVGNVDIANPTTAATTTATTPQTGMVVEQYVAPDCRRLEVLTLNGQIISTLPADFEVFVKATDESLKRFNCIPSDDTTDTSTTDDSVVTTTDKKDDDDPVTDKIVTTDPQFDLTTAEGSMAAADYFAKKSGVDVSNPFAAATNALNSSATSSLFEKGVGLVSLALGPVAMLGAAAIKAGSKLDALSTAYANLKMANYLGNSDMAKNIQTEIDKFLDKTPNAIKFLASLTDLGDKKFDYALMSASSIRAPDNMALTQDRFATEEAFVASMNENAQRGMKYDPTAGEDGKGAYVIDRSQTVAIPDTAGGDDVIVSAASPAATASSATRDSSLQTGVTFTPGEDTIRPVLRPGTGSLAERPKTPEEKGAAASNAISEWQKATEATKGKKGIELHKAIKAQSEASKKATAAIREKTGYTGFWGSKGGLMKKGNK